jgi:hypothetical protein
MLAVHPVSVDDVFFILAEIFGFADPTMLLADVGGYAA